MIDPSWGALTPDTLRHLRERLVALADLLPPGPATEVRAVLAEIDRDRAVGMVLRAGRR